MFGSGRWMGGGNTASRSAPGAGRRKRTVYDHPGFGVRGDELEETYEWTSGDESLSHMLFARSHGEQHRGHGSLVSKESQSVALRRKGHGSTRGRGEEEESTKRFDLKGRCVHQKDVVKALATIEHSAQVVDLSMNNLERVTFVPVQVCVLSLAKNCLTTLRDLESLVCLQELDVSFNKLETLSGLFNSAQTLVTINACHNKLKCVDGLETMFKLKHLDVSHNRVEKISMLRSLSCNLNLTELRLSDNPVAATARFRQVIMDLNPSLVLLDGLMVSSSPMVGAGQGRNWTYSSLYSSRKQARENPPDEYEGRLVEEHEYERLVSGNEYRIKTPERKPAKKKKTPTSAPPATRTSYSALDRIAHSGKRPFDEDTRDELLNVTFDNEFEEPAARFIVEQLRQEQDPPQRAYTSSIESPPPPTRTENNRSRTGPRTKTGRQKQVTRLSSNRPTPGQNVDINTGLSEDVTRKLRQLIDKKKQSLQTLTNALAKYH
uniref:Uncharacterized protein n=1 Tax=Mucochytrium quahogii TaxID=96639 RepID=A0A7S2WJC7_9STRA|mmetsp:Transcript_4269/g.6287  ORF Transcript_4269/g.6287 Transcript_4269/m.6287 type:complete len:491 (+) Transcript_4269:90-1562(+)